LAVENLDVTILILFEVSGQIYGTFYKYSAFVTLTAALSYIKAIYAEK
jgi:hypothetical protein